MRSTGFFDECQQCHDGAPPIVEGEHCPTILRVVPSVNLSFELRPMPGV
jgi:hypothetical protein